jgi:Predicted branched-chain amino acid permease (azaleucine resistance)
VHRDVVAGITDSLPVLLGIIPFGLIAGIAAVEAGLSPAQAIGMSAIVFAGASQLAAIELLGESAPVVVVIVTAVVINLRLLMYSASIAPYLSQLSRVTRTGLAYLLVDQVYAMSIAQYQSDIDRSRPRYYVGLGLSLWTVWMATTTVGAIVGTGVPESLELSFAVPLVFLALLMPAMKDRGTTVAGVVGGTVGVTAAGLPLNLGLPAGAVAGILAGLLADSSGGEQ